MPTLTLGAYSKAYPAISNRIKASIFLQSDPQAFIASIIDSIPGHPARIWTFPGLPRNNYGFSLDEIDGGGIVVRNIALFDVEPGTLNGAIFRDDEQIKVGTTTGFNVGDNTFVFDGTGGKPDYRTWTIVPSELTGRGILALGLDYSWDSVTGTFLLLQTGDVFALNQIYNIHFDPVGNTAGNSYPTITDFGINIITSDTVLDNSYFGKKLIVEPAGMFVNVTLPDIATVPQGRNMLVEIGGADLSCVKFTPSGGDLINWLNGNLYALRGESFSIYAFARPASAKEWRICNEFGNYYSFGESVGEEATEGYNKQLLNGSVKNKNQYARIYNEYVLHLDPSQVVNFDDWDVGNNKYFFSLANSSDPGNTDLFHFPNRKGLFERNNDTGKSGDYAEDTLKAHGHRVNTGGNGTGANPGKSLVRQSYNGDGYTSQGTGTSSNGPYIEISGDTETSPKNYLINKFIKL